MKTAISLPDALNESIEDFLEVAGISRSEFFQRAARDYLKRVSARAIRGNLDEVYGGDEHPGDRAFRRAALAHFRDLVKDESW